MSTERNYPPSSSCLPSTYYLIPNEDHAGPASRISATDVRMLIWSRPASTPHRRVSIGFACISSDEQAANHPLDQLNDDAQHRQPDSVIAMATNSITALLHDPEPLPRYTRDPETASVTSVAPSYTSEAPSYHSTHPENPTHNATSPAADSAPNPTRRIITFHMNPSQPSGHRTPTGTRTPQAQQTAAQRHRARYTMEAELHTLAARMMHPSRITFPDSAGFMNEAKARKAYIRELREEAALREKGKMWGYCVGQIRGREERQRIWQGKTGGSGEGVGLGVRG
ncbi:hypothetical protein G7Y79_00049g084710 [Physcia stellaris]|nr:hypothetical protein G7Y79_00049g084710 [Physcia stellaris]